MNNNHEIYLDQSQAWLSGHLDAGAVSQLEAHLADCPECAARAADEKELWELLGQGAVCGSDPVSSVWPSVQQRTFGKGSNGAWFFGGGQLMRASLAACAVAAGLMVGVLVPGLSTTATADEINSDLWVSEASWLDETATDGLAGIWLDPGMAEESDGS